MEQCSDIFKSNEDADLLQTLRSAGQSGERNRVDEISVKFQEHAEQLQEVIQSKNFAQLKLCYFETVSRLAVISYGIFVRVILGWCLYFSFFQACKLLRHIAQTEQLMVWTEHAETSIKGLSPQVNDVFVDM